MSDTLVAAAEQCHECNARLEPVRGVVVCPRCDCTDWWEPDVALP